MVSKRIGYTISVVARTYGVHPQTLRSYERHGLLTPSRSSGNTRLYTEKDLLRLEIILNLTRELGVNLAGVEVILNMREKIVRMQDEVGQLFEFLKTRFDLDPDLFRDRFPEALVPSPPSKLVQSSKPGVDRRNT